jgi:hypothetical protein
MNGSDYDGGLECVGGIENIFLTTLTRLVRDVDPDYRKRTSKIDRSSIPDHMRS